MKSKKKQHIKITTDDDLKTETAETRTDELPVQEPQPESELDAVRRELADAKDQFLRAKAEQQNIQKRSAQERVEALRYANSTLVKDLISTIDDFERALEHGGESNVQGLLKGMQLVHDNFLKVLNDHNVETIDPMGQAFDPRYHEAMLQQPAEDKEPGTIIQVVQRGYQLNDRVLRPAQVIIAGAEKETPVDSSMDQEERAQAVEE